MTRTLRRTGRLALGLVATCLLVLGLAACGSSSDDSSASSGSATSSSGTQDLGLNKAGTLTVGMNLQFEPEMYLDKQNQPAGYDVDMLKALAKDLGVKLDIKNLDFNGLIPGLQAKQFDMVSVGFSPTPERKNAVSFSRSYVPYSVVVAQQPGTPTPSSYDAYNSSSEKMTALQGSTSETLIKDKFPKAKLSSFSEQNAALLQVATKRADAAVMEDYILARYLRANPGSLEQATFPQPLDLQYGSYAVQKGNTALANRLDQFICKAQTDGTMETLYKKNFQTPSLPKMPAC